MVTIKGIQSHEAEKWWPFVEEWVAEALNRGGALINVDDVKEDVAAAKNQIWLAVVNGILKAVCVTQIDEWKRGKTLCAFAIGGEDMETWAEALDDTLTRYAQYTGCTHVTGGGRKGWEKTLKKLGWTTSASYIKRV